MTEKFDSVRGRKILKEILSKRIPPNAFKTFAEIADAFEQQSKKENFPSISNSTIRRWVRDDLKYAKSKDGYVPSKEIQIEEQKKEVKDFLLQSKPKIHDDVQYFELLSCEANLAEATCKKLGQVYPDLHFLALQNGYIMIWYSDQGKQQLEELKDLLS